MPPRPLDHQHLLHRCAASAADEEAWSHLVQLYDAKILGWARYYLEMEGCREDSSEDAKEIRMETWLNLVRCDRRALARFASRDEISFRAYLARITWNNVCDRRRREASMKRPNLKPFSQEAFQALLEKTASGAADAETIFARAELREKATRVLRRAWRRRPLRDRDLLICQLAWFHGVSNPGVASIGSFRLTRRGVEKVKRRGLDVLREKLGVELEDPGAESSSRKGGVR